MRWPVALAVLALQLSGCRQLVEVESPQTTPQTLVMVELRPQLSGDPYLESADIMIDSNGLEEGYFRERAERQSDGSWSFQAPWGKLVQMEIRRINGQDVALLSQPFRIDATVIEVPIAAIELAVSVEGLSFDWLPESLHLRFRHYVEHPLATHRISTLRRLDGDGFATCLVNAEAQIELSLFGSSSDVWVDWPLASVDADGSLASVAFAPCLGGLDLTLGGAPLSPQFLELDWNSTLGNMNRILSSEDLSELVGPCGLADLTIRPLRENAPFLLLRQRLAWSEGAQQRLDLGAHRLDVSIRDDQDAFVPRAQLRIVEALSFLQQSRRVDDEGNFTIYLSPGDYQLQAVSEFGLSSGPEQLVNVYADTAVTLRLDP